MTEISGHAYVDDRCLFFTSPQMTESPAEERYRAFQRLRSSFNSENADKDARIALHHEHKKENSETWRKIDNHSEARLSVAHLISLVEEGNSLLQALSPGKLCTTMVKDRWKRDLTKSNNLNLLGFDSFDSLDTASVISCSSAYSTKSDSSLMSPSIVELSDTGSCDTHQEYDIKSHKVQIGTEKCIDVSTNDEASLPVFSTNHTIEEDISCNFVKQRTQVWNDLIGDWEFKGLLPAPTFVYKYRVTNEIMVPLPLRTTEEIMESGGRNSSPSEVSPSSISEDHFSQVPPGKFTLKIKCSTSDLISFFDPLSGKEDRLSRSRSHTGIDSTADSKTEDFKESGECDEITVTVTAKRDGREEDNTDVREKIIRKEENEIPEGKAFITNDAKEDNQKTSKKKDVVSDNCISKVSVKVLYDKKRNTITHLSMPVNPTKPSKWREAHKLYRALQAVMEPQNSHHTNIMSVKQRTQRFGRIKTKIV